MPQVSRGSALSIMQYQVLARKWRPQNFCDLVGQDHVSRTLLNALESGRVAHAFLFAGPRGSGKTSTARILAKALNCREGKPGEPCGKCVACFEIAAGNCMDVLEIDAASNRGIDEIRELKEKARYNPARDKYKIFIIDEVHMLTPEAFNALLKILEEPPSHIIFILATTEYHKIPATILSRCQQYSFKLIQYPLIIERLSQIAKAEDIQISNMALEQVVFSSGGSMRDAMSALDQVIAFSGNSVRDEDVSMLLGLVEPQVLGDTVRAIAKNDLASILQITAGLVEAGQDLNNFCRRLLGQFRNLMVLKAGIADPTVLGIPASLAPDLCQQADLFSQEDLLRIFDAFLKIEADLKYATQARFQLEMGLIELAHISRLRPLEDILTEFTRMTEGEAFNRPEVSKSSPSIASQMQGERREAPVRQTKPHSNPDRISAPPIPKASVRTGFEDVADLEKPSAGEMPGELLPNIHDSRELLLKIAAAVHRGSLESLLQELKGARIQGDRLILESGTASEFFRQQIKENLPLVTQAASEIVGRPLTVVIEHPSASSEGQLKMSSPTLTENSAEVDLLDRVKREPVIKSFLDVFPGPVKAEKIDL